MAASLRVSWRNGVSIEPAADGGRRVQSPGSQVLLHPLPTLTAEALNRLVPPGADEDDLSDLMLDGGGPNALASWYYRLQDLSRRGLICRTVQVDGQRIATLFPISPAFTFAPSPPLPDRPLRLSRFTYLRRDLDAFVLESPQAHARIVLDDARSVGLIGALVRPATPQEVAGRVPDLPSEAATLLLNLLATAGMLSTTDSAGTEIETAALKTWEFHDLLFHARVRQGRSDAPYGATYRMLGRLDPPPPVKPAVTGEVTELFRPDQEQGGGNGPTFASVVARRRSVRAYGERPITVRQLGEFLYRVARVTAVREMEVDTPGGPYRMTFAGRPYPAGGGLYELEFYLAVNNCDGLSPGLYHYDAEAHRLVRRCGRTTDFGRLIADAASSSGIPDDRLQVVIVLASRFQRIAWKYASIAYALTLKHVGVVYQTMYLTATAMGLAPCGLGGGDADLFARVAGTDYYAETSVGEFLLGSSGSGSNS